MASKKKRKKKSPPQERRIYVIEILNPQEVPGLAPGLKAGKSCFYVGETGNAPEGRFQQHLRGVASYKKALAAHKAGLLANPDAKRRRPVGLAEPFRRVSRHKNDADLVDGVDIVLRYDLFRNVNPRRGKLSANVGEAKRIDSLRRNGHVTYPETQSRCKEPFFK
jgi:hypothetical protein